MDGWFRAAEQGDTAIVLAHLDRGIDVNARGDRDNYRGVTALMIAVIGRRIETIEALIRRGADVRIEVDWGCWTAMTFAAIQARGFDLTSPGWTIRDPDPRPMQLLAAAGGQFGLREAILLDDVDLARRICDRDPSIDVSGDARFSFDRTYLMLAAELGSLDMVNFLIDRGAEIDGTDDIGHTALMKAAEGGHVEIVSRLLDHGAEVNGGWPCVTALAEAEAGGHHGVATLLVSRGAKHRLLDAVNRDDLRLAEKLLRDGADPELEDSWVRDDPAHHDSGESRIIRLAMHAVARGHVEMVRLLLDHGVSHHRKYWDAHPLLAEAARQGHEDVVRLLIEHGADVNDVGTDGLTALEWAARRGHTAIVEPLLKAGANR